MGQVAKTDPQTHLGETHGKPGRSGIARRQRAMIVVPSGQARSTILWHTRPRACANLSRGLLGYTGRGGAFEIPAQRSSMTHGHNGVHDTTGAVCFGVP